MVVAEYGEAEVLVYADILWVMCFKVDWGLLEGAEVEHRPY